MNESIRVGLLSTISPEKFWAEEILQESKDWLVKARQSLQGAGLEVLDEDVITQSHQQAGTHARNLAHRGAELLILYVGRWSYSSAIVAAGLESKLPIIIWTNTRDDTGGIIGAGIAKGALEEVGIQAPLIHGDFKDEDTINQIVRLAKVRSAYSKLRRMTYGVCGGRSLGMYTAVIDANEWRKKFGVEVDAFDQAGLITEAERMPTEKVKLHVNWVKERFGAIKTSDQVLEAQIRLYLAVKDIVEFRGYDFLSIRCLPEMPTAYTTFCLAHALLNDAVDAEGEKKRIITACEADNNGALTMMLLHLLSGEEVAMGDVWHLEKDTNMLHLSNCGSQPTDFALNPKQVNIVPHRYSVFEWKIGGCCPQHVSRPGKMTIARLGRKDGRYTCLITSGDAQEYPIEEMDKGVWGFSPHSYIRLDCSYQDFLNEINSNHMHITYGDHKQSLAELCKLFEVEPILI